MDAISGLAWFRIEHCLWRELTAETDRQNQIMGELTDDHWKVVLGRLARLADDSASGGRPMFEHLKEKMARVATSTPELAKRIEARADAYFERVGEIEKKTERNFGRHDSVLDMADAGLDGLEEALRPLSNAPLDGSQSS